jgi:hypothetical protein
MSDVLIEPIVVGAVAFMIVSQLKGDGVDLEEGRPPARRGLHHRVRRLGRFAKRRPSRGRLHHGQRLDGSGNRCRPGRLDRAAALQRDLVGTDAGPRALAVACLNVSRVGVTVLAIALGAKTGYSIDSVLLALGVNRLAQAAPVGAKGLRVGATLAR